VVVIAGAVLLLALAVSLLVADQDVSHVWDGLLIPAVMFTGTTLYRAEHGQIPRWQAAATIAVVAAALLTNWFAELASLDALTPKYMARSVITLLVIGVPFAIGMAWRRTPRFLAWLGRVSYSTYLIHVPLIALLAVPLTILGQRLRGPIELVAVAGFLGLLFGLSWLTHRYIELPGQHLARRFADTSLPRRPSTTLPAQSDPGLHQRGDAGLRTRPSTGLPQRADASLATRSGNRLPRQRGAAPQQSDTGDGRAHRDGGEVEPVDQAVRVAD
jgi:peptidoglycan/LPS O-acetylase OafA/YrhL